MAYLTVGYLSKVVVVATSPRTELRIVLAAVESPLANAWERFCGDVSYVTVRRASTLDVATDAVVDPANSYGFMDGGKVPAYPLLSRTADGFAANCGMWPWFSRSPLPRLRSGEPLASGSSVSGS